MARKKKTPADSQRPPSRVILREEHFLMLDEYGDRLRQQRQGLPSWGELRNVQALWRASAIPKRVLKTAQMTEKLDALEAELGLTPIGSTPSDGVRARNAGYRAALDRYIERATVENTRLPGRAGQGENALDLVVIADAAEVPYPVLAGSTSMKAKLYVAAKKVGVAQSAGAHKVVSHSWAGLPELDGYLRREHDDKGRPLIANVSHPDRPCIALLAQRTGCRPLDLRPGGRLHWRVAETFESVGAQLPAPAVAKRTYGDLLNWGLAEIGREKAANAAQRCEGTREQVHEAASISPQVKSELKVAKYHLSAFMEAMEKTENDPIGKEFAPDLEANIENALAIVRRTKGWGVETERKFRTRMRHWGRLLGMMPSEGAIPANFSQALDQLCRTRHLSTADLYRMTGVPRAQLQSWRTRSTPWPGSYANVLKVERALGVPDHTLWCLVPARVARRRPQSRPGSPLAGADRADAQRRRFSQDGQFSAYKLRQSSVSASLPRFIWNETLEADWGRYASYKKASLPVGGMRRTPGAKWTLATEKKARAHFHQFFRFMAIPADLGGFNFDVSHADLVAVLDAQRAIDFIDWTARNRAQILKDLSDDWAKKNPDRVYVAVDVDILLTFATLLRPGYGWLEQQPEFARRIEERENLMSLEVAAQARHHWRTACARAYDLYNRRCSELREVVTPMRDPFAPIETFFLHENPLALYKAQIRAMEDDLPDVRAAPQYHHRHVRLCVAMRLATALFFRAKNLGNLTFRPDNTGQLRYADGRFFVVIAGSEFKNRRNKDIYGPQGDPHPVLKELPDEDGLYGLLTYYLQISWPYLKNGRKTDLIFSDETCPNEAVDRMSARFSYLFRYATSRYFVFDEACGLGLEGVLVHGPHAVRHIGATTMIRQGRVQDAADLLLISVEVARQRYAKYLPADRLANVRGLLAEATAKSIEISKDSSPVQLARPIWQSSDERRDRFMPVSHPFAGRSA